jgi:hypothetical protein
MVFDRSLQWLLEILRNGSGSVIQHAAPSCISVLSLQSENAFSLFFSIVPSASPQSARSPFQFASKKSTKIYCSFTVIVKTRQRLPETRRYRKSHPDSMLFGFDIYEGLPGMLLIITGQWFLS